MTRRIDLRPPFKFKFLTGDVCWEEHGGTWISRKLCNGDFDFYLVLSLERMDNTWDDETDTEYLCQLNVVSPEAANEESIAGACSFTGCPYESWETLDQEIQVDVLSANGTRTPVWHAFGSSYRDLFKEALAFARNELATFFGSIMDRPVNRVGTTGWEAVRGDWMAWLDRPSPNPETTLCKKLHGFFE